MELLEVKRRVRAIRDAVGDPETAHALEDDLHECVLKAIADGVPNAAELAKEALKSKNIKFPRWCA